MSGRKKQLHRLWPHCSPEHSPDSYLTVQLSFSISFFVKLDMFWSFYEPASHSVGTPINKLNESLWHGFIVYLCKILFLNFFLKKIILWHLIPEVQPYFILSSTVLCLSFTWTKNSPLDPTSFKILSFKALFTVLLSVKASWSPHLIYSVLPCSLRLACLCPCCGSSCFAFYLLSSTSSSCHCIQLNDWPISVPWLFV